MDNPQRPGGDGDDGPGRPPRKIVDNPQDEFENEAGEQGVLEAFGDQQELPAWVFLFLAAIFAEHLRGYYTCGC